MKEEELYEPIKGYFKDFGYKVDGEVGDCDMLCIKEGHMIAVELKNELNFKVFIQAAKRQKLFETVFIGCWTPKNLRNKGFLDKVYVLNRLGIGLIFVSRRTLEAMIYCEAVYHPIEAYKTRNKGRTTKLANELNSRRMVTNTGGTNRKKIMTLYKENSLLILDYLYEHGPTRCATVKAQLDIKNVYSIVYQNHYKWFEKKEKGIYHLSEQGVDAYREHAGIIEKLKS